MKMTLLCKFRVAGKVAHICTKYDDIHNTITFSCFGILYISIHLIYISEVAGYCHSSLVSHPLSSNDGFAHHKNQNATETPPLYETPFAMHVCFWNVRSLFSVKTEPIHPHVPM